MRKQNSVTTMNRREMLKLSAVALIGASIIPDKTQATQTVAMKPIAFAGIAAEAFRGCRGEVVSRLGAD